MIKCGFCDQDMEFRGCTDKEETHQVFSCTQCPAIIFEYYDDSDIEKLKKLINLEKK